MKRTPSTLALRCLRHFRAIKGAVTLKPCMYPIGGKLSSYFRAIKGAVTLKQPCHPRGLRETVLHFRAIKGAVTLKQWLAAHPPNRATEFPRHQRRGHIEA